MADYLRGKVGDCSFICFGFIVQTNRHTAHVDATKRLTHATIVNVSNELHFDFCSVTIIVNYLDKSTRSLETK